MSWFDLTPHLPDEDSLDGFDLRVGTFDGRTTATIIKRFGPLAPSGAFRGALPVASGPSEGLVAYAFWDGTRSEIHVLDAVTGEDRLFARRDQIVHGLAIDGIRQLLYVIELDPTTRAESGIFRASLDGTGAPQSVSGSGTQQAPRAGDQIWERVWVTPDGANLVVVDCPDRCRARSVHLDVLRLGGSFVFGSEDVVGVSNQTLVTLFGCAPPCAASAYPLSGGAARPIGAFCERGVLVVQDGRVVLVSDRPFRGVCGTGAYVVARTDVESAAEAEILTADTRDRAIVTKDDTQGYEAPDGWFVLAAGGRPLDATNGAPVAPWLVRIADGQVIQLPAQQP